MVGIFFTHPTDVNYLVTVSENLFSNEGLCELPGYYYIPVWGYMLSAVTSIIGVAGIPLGEYVHELVTNSVVLEWANTLPPIGMQWQLKLCCLHLIYWSP